MQGAPSQLDVVVTYLERTQAPLRAPAPLSAPARIARERTPELLLYRRLYNAVGEKWLWHERRSLDDGALARIIHDDRVEVHVLYVGDEPAGYFELDRRAPREVQLAYFGLVPDFIGRGLGRPLLDHAVWAAFRGQPSRVWVHTCTLDHARALPLYRSSGFSTYRRESIQIPDPRASGVFG